VNNFQGNKFSNFLVFKNFEKIFLKTQVQLILNTSVAPFKSVFFKNSEFYFKNIYWDFEIFENIFLQKLPTIRYSIIISFNCYNLSQSIDTLKYD